MGRFISRTIIVVLTMMEIAARGQSVGTMKGGILTADTIQKIKKSTAMKPSFGLGVGWASSQTTDVASSTTTFPIGNSPFITTGSSQESSLAGASSLLYYGDIGARNERVAIGGRFSSTRQSFTRGYSASGNYTITTHSLLLYGLFYLSRTKVKPFLGGGLGGYIIISSGISAVGYKIGFCPRAGLEVGHFVLSLEYNFIGTTAGYFEGSKSSGRGTATYYTYDSHYRLNYFGATAGFYIGGHNNKSANQ